MKRITILLQGFALFSLAACAQQQKIADVSASQPLAFPGAEGFGKWASGGREGKVLIVSNLNDKGPGSFREAAEAKGKRIVVFAISGTIHLETKVSIKGDVTIAGQTAPGDGICLADQSIGLGGNNIIVRYIRFRMGDKYQNGGMIDGAGADDAFGGVRRSNIIIDHCSLSWSTDEVFSIYAGDSTTLQWNLIAEPLNYSYHFETGDKDYEHHGFGAIWGGKHLTAHHNLFAHCSNRNPRFDGIRNTPEENVDYRNNVVYNWGGNNIYAGEGGSYNIVNNYFKYGPSTSKSVRYRIVNPGKRETAPVIPFGKWYVQGNYVDEAVDVTSNNYKGIHMGNNGTEDDKKTAVLAEAVPAEAIPVQSATDAYEAVLRMVGASHRRDTLDERIINDVKNRTGGFIDVQGGFPHGTPYELTVNAWPHLKTAPSPADADKDGMPDEWEKKNGLNPSDAADAVAYKISKGYTNIEVYINSLVR
ncbi:MAG TPA: pectate lyase [Chitinophagaceae bacterium]|nr:pectate lyase [Chitinophagaceae bacterium]